MQDSNYSEKRELLFMETKGISKLDLKRRNRKQILLAIRQAGMLARVDIAAQLSLTRAAVTIITNQMITQNILEDLNSPIENRSEPKKKGRKKTMIRINPTYRYVLGAVVNELNVSIGLADINNQPVGNRFFPVTNDSTPEEIISFIVKSCRELMQEHDLTQKQILGLGIGIVPMRWEQLRADVQGNSVTFEKLCYMLEMELSMPVLAESAISLYALAGVDYTDSTTANQVLLYSGQKYHSAAILHNELIGGFGRDTSSIDRIIVNPDGAPCEGLPNGTVHAELTRSALLAKASAIAGETMTIEALNEAYDANDPRFTELMEDIISMIARIVYNLCTSTEVRCATLQCFQLAKTAHIVLQKKLDELTAGQEPIQLRFSSIDGTESYRAGSALAIEKLFFEQGGMLPGETNI